MQLSSPALLSSLQCVVIGCHLFLDQFYLTLTEIPEKSKFSVHTNPSRVLYIFPWSGAAGSGAGGYLCLLYFLQFQFSLFAAILHSHPDTKCAMDCISHYI